MLLEETFHGLAPCRSVDDWIMDTGYLFVKLIVIFDVLVFCYFIGHVARIGCPLRLAGAGAMPW